MAKEKPNKTTENEEIIEAKSEVVVKKHNDLKIGFAFTLEDADGKQIQLSDILTFKCALEPGMINSIVRRIEGTLKELGQDYFMTLLRDYISKKQEAIYAEEALRSYNKHNSAQQDDIKYIANGVVEHIGNNVDDESNDPSSADYAQQIASQFGDGADELPIE